MEDENLTQSTEKWRSGLFWLLAAIGLGIIGWKFFGAQDEPMEQKILIVFSTFLMGAVLFRWLLKDAQDERLKAWGREAIEWSDTGISAVLLAFVIMSFIVQAFKIPSGSMIPTLQIGDHLFVNKFHYGSQVPFTLKKFWHYKDAKRNDVVVFLCPPQALSQEEREAGVQKDFIKRAIGLAGDTVEIRNKVVYVNGEPFEDPHKFIGQEVIYPKPQFWSSEEEYQQAWQRGEFVYLPAEAIRDNFGPITVPQNSIFVMGDNRDGSFDSRFWGPLPEKYLKGKAWLLYWPLPRWRQIH